MKIMVKRATKIVKREFNKSHKKSEYVYCSSILIINKNYKNNISSRCIKRLTRIIENLHYKYWKEQFQLNILSLIYGSIEMASTHTNFRDSVLRKSTV